MKIKTLLVWLVVVISFHQAKAAMNTSQIKQKHIVFELFNVLINVDIDKKIDELVCNNVYASQLVPTYKSHREKYSPTKILMRFRMLMTIDWQCGNISEDYISAEYIKNLPAIYALIKEEIETELCPIDESAIKAGIAILFGHDHKIINGGDELRLDQCFSINPHGLALLDYILDVGPHQVYIIENLPSGWGRILANKFRNVFELIYPTLAGLSEISSLPHDSKCFFSCDAKKSIVLKDFVSSFYSRYNVNPSDCVLIAFSSDVCKTFRRKGAKAVGFGVLDFIPERQKSDNWQRIIEALKDYEVFERDRMYSYLIPIEYFGNTQP